MMKETEIKTLTPKDREIFPDALELLNRTQGRGLFLPDYLEKKTESPHARVYGAFQKHSLVGVGVAELIDDFSFYAPFDPDIVTYNGTRAGSFSTLCVREDLQGQGIGQMISRKRLQFLKDQKVPFILGVSWVSNLGHTSDRVFKKMGFTEVKSVDLFFKEWSIKKPFDCPGCKVQPCICSAILFRLDLN